MTVSNRTSSVCEEKVEIAMLQFALFEVSFSRVDKVFFKIGITFAIPIME